MMIKKFKLAMLVILPLILGSLGSYGQGARLKITDIQIAENSGRYERYADKEANLSSDVPITVLMFRENNVSYYTNFLFTQRGRKLRLKISDYVIYNDEKISGQTQKLKQRITEDLDDERMVGVREETLTYDAELENGIRVVFRFEVLY